MTHRSLAVCAVLALAGFGRADLISPAPEHDAGQARSGVALVHHFELVNDGKETVEIGAPRAGCGCLRPAVGRQTLRPGEKTQCSVEVNTVTQSAGDNTWRVLVPYRQGSQQGEVLLQLRAHLIPELTITPATVIIHTDKAISHTLTLTQRRQAPLPIRAGVTTSAHVTARGAEPTKEGDVWRQLISLDVSAGHPDGRHEHVLHLHTADPTYPELKVAFTVVKRGPGGVQASPAEVEWRGGESALAAKIVLLSSSDGEAVEVEKVEPGHPSLAGTFARGPGPRSTLRILCGEVPPGGLQSSLRVHLSKPAGQVVTVPVRIVP